MTSSSLHIHNGPDLLDLTLPLATRSRSANPHYSDIYTRTTKIPSSHGNSAIGSPRSGSSHRKLIVVGSLTGRQGDGDVMPLALNHVLATNFFFETNTCPPRVDPQP